MKTLLAFVILVLLRATVHGAIPSSKDFFGTGGITVVSNGATITIDGSAISSPTGGVSAASATGIVTAALSYLATNVVWVSKAGNDTTAARSRVDLPAQTTAKARSLAIAGDTVCVLPGIYQNCTNLGKPGVNWSAPWGATLVNTNMTNTFDPGWGIFDDRFGGASTTKVSGFSFLWNGGLPSTNSSGVACCQNTNLMGAIVVTNPLSRFVFDVSRMDYAVVQPLLQSISAVHINRGTNFFTWSDGIYDLYRTNSYIAGTDIDGDPVIEHSEGTALYWERGDIHFKAPWIEGGHYSYWGHDPKASNTTEIANAYLNINVYQGVFYVDGNGNTGYKTWAQGHELRSVIGQSYGDTVSSISLISPGLVYLDGFDKILTSGIGLIGGSSEVWITSQKISSSANFATANGGTMRLTVQHYEDYAGTVTSGLDVRTGGNLIAQGGFMVLTNGRGGILESSGTMTLNGVTINTGLSTNSALFVRTNGLTLAGCTLICTNSRFAISSDVNATNTVKIYNSSGTSDATNKLTVQVGPWTVDQNVQ